ncbi:MAG: branched-chain amino acid ABC transporter permease [Beijerinckiaceae bacterium]|nr:branched-chain amino acid ABC transporter permease [Beijerinckiaceae bacterium]
MKASSQSWIVAIALAVAIALPLVAPTYYVQFASKALLMGLLAVALNLVVGFGGMVSLCHAALFGLAGYSLAFLTPEGEGASIWLSLPAAVLVSSFAALVIGALSLRTKGIYFIMVTLAFGEMLFYLLHDTKIGGGSDGLYIYLKPEFGFGGAALDLERASTFYFVVLVCLVLGVALVSMLVRSPFGHALVAARDNERRARSLGFPVYRIRLTAFVISGALAGVAGYFSAAQFGFVAPQLLGWHLSATVLVMVVLGGMTSVLGPLAGALAIIGLEEVLKSNFEYWKLIYGLIVMAMVFVLPGGLQQLASMVLGAKPASEDDAVERDMTAPHDDAATDRLRPELLRSEAKAHV